MILKAALPEVHRSARSLVAGELPADHTLKPGRLATASAQSSAESRREEPLRPTSRLVASARPAELF